MLHTTVSTNLAKLKFITSTSIDFWRPINPKPTPSNLMRLMPNIYHPNSFLPITPRRKIIKELVATGSLLAKGNSLIN
jgi:hypothetical protein